MSSAKTTTIPAAADADADTRPKILLHPVPIYDSPLAKGVSVGRVAVLLGLLAWGMDSLVADPASALQRALPVVAAVQAVYATLCIPPAGSASRAGKKPRPGEKTKKNDGSTSVISSVIVALVLSALTVPALYALLVLFGAPFLAHTAHTVLCAAHFALLAVFPVVHARGLDRSALVAVAGAAAPLDEPYGALVGAAAGAWLGAVPIPLDWDRDWQRWPVTVVVGAYVGAAAGSLLAGTVLYGKRLAGHAVKAD
ncbi:GPI-anchor biosynthesis protein, putative [Cordyceps militaris CM01]|uniref:GPI-anchor biosynthesis protein, putative n=1 Tax=Cordyceps militaris (strain CM01) TaxID=983644 RepID=G3J338_CORMM|nr:GPI-anchor biosynthesis protein, putative [Cordyceps militaris CM01]EGX95621.1 GPI-anchor biosynthesis protein, putative [Cordyceps militaris CM01]